MTKYFNLNLDDVHPETSRDIADCGGDMEKGVFGYLLRLIEEFPKIKITLFVTPNWIYKPADPLPIRLLKKVFGLKYINRWDDEPFRLDKHTEWCDWLNELIKRGNIEVAIHGLYHYVDSYPHAAEFRDLPYDECRRRLILAEEIFKSSGLKYVKGFRPPGWGISKDLFKALRDLDYMFVSLDPIACKIPTEKLPRFRISIYEGLINVPQNWDIKKGTVREAIGILERYEILSAKGHIQDRYGREYIGNGLNHKSYENIRNLLIKIEEYGLKIKFAKMSEVANEFRKSL